MQDTYYAGTAEHMIDVMQFRHNLLEWGKEHFRAFPWRQTRDSYRVLISEILLHRTQASQVLPIYQAFLQCYPDLAMLAQAPKEALHHILYSLGLRWRIDLLQRMVADLMARFHGQIPQEKEQLLSLPGVSEYIASAVRCFAWGIPEPIIDTNVVRIISRVFDLALKDSSRRNQQYRKLITALLDPVNPRMYNYALLDLAAQICTKRSIPLCTQCPLQELCVYGVRVLAQSSVSE